MNKKTVFDFSRYMAEAYNNERGVFPTELRGSGVMFWKGERITIEDWREYAKARGDK